MSSASLKDISSNLLKKRQELLKKLVFEETPTGEWVLNKAKVASVVAAEGLTFVDCTAFEGKIMRQLYSCDCDHRTAAVFLFKRSQFSGRPVPESVPYVIARGQLPDYVFEKFIMAIESMTPQIEIVKWLRGYSDDCVVCYKTLTGSFLTEKRMTCTICGILQCIGCFIDMCLIADTELTIKCPNCRYELEPISSFQTLISSTTEALQRGTVGAMTDEHLDFIQKTTGIDLALPRQSALAKAKSVRWLFETIIHKYIVKFDICYLKFQMEMYKELRQAIDGMRKKEVASASAERSRSSGVLARGGCANCGKPFWDKSDWRRAPKCLKCRKSAYCTTKCRKKHGKAHAGECSAKGLKKKKKAKKKKPRKGGCAP